MGNGGGISATNFSNPTIQGNLISGNTAYNASGGGIAIQNYNGATIVQNVVANNISASGGSWTGLYISAAQGTPVTIADNTIYGNVIVAQTSGGEFPQLITFVNNIVVVPTGQQAVICDGSYSTVSPLFLLQRRVQRRPGNPGWASVTTQRIQETFPTDPLFVNPAV